ncbi:hypothetical protein TYRP_020284 [Tyrophagus putrescentiae]|nr:hypothetical protein TYRP_020284 [Tyrophagus putrescentiae]
MSSIRPLRITQPHLQRLVQVGDHLRREDHHIIAVKGRQEEDALQEEVLAVAGHHKAGGELVLEGLGAAALLFQLELVLAIVIAEALIHRRPLSHVQGRSCCRVHRAGLLGKSGHQGGLGQRAVQVEGLLVRVGVINGPRSVAEVLVQAVDGQRDDPIGRARPELALADAALGGSLGGGAVEGHQQVKGDDAAAALVLDVVVLHEEQTLHRVVLVLVVLVVLEADGAQAAFLVQAGQVGVELGEEAPGALLQNRPAGGHARQRLPEDDRPLDFAEVIGVGVRAADDHHQLVGGGQNGEQQGKASGRVGDEGLREKRGGGGGSEKEVRRKRNRFFLVWFAYLNNFFGVHRGELGGTGEWCHHHHYHHHHHGHQQSEHLEAEGGHTTDQYTGFSDFSVVDVYVALRGLATSNRLRRYRLQLLLRGRLFGCHLRRSSLAPHLGRNLRGSDLAGNLARDDRAGRTTDRLVLLDPFAATLSPLSLPTFASLRPDANGGDEDQHQNDHQNEDANDNVEHRIAGGAVHRCSDVVWGGGSGLASGGGGGGKIGSPHPRQRTGLPQQRRVSRVVGHLKRQNQQWEAAKERQKKDALHQVLASFLTAFLTAGHHKAGAEGLVEGQAVAGLLLQLELVLPMVITEVARHRRPPLSHVGFIRVRTGLGLRKSCGHLRTGQRAAEGDASVVDRMSHRLVAEVLVRPVHRQRYDGDGRARPVLRLADAGLAGAVAGAAQVKGDDAGAVAAVLVAVLHEEQTLRRLLPVLVRLVLVVAEADDAHGGVLTQVIEVAGQVGEDLGEEAPGALLQNRPAGGHARQRLSEDDRILQRTAAFVFVVLKAADDHHHLVGGQHGEQQGRESWLFGVVIFERMVTLDWGAFVAREAFVEATALAAEAEAEEEGGACFEPLWALEDVLFSSCFFFLRELQQKQKRTAPPMSAQISTTMRRISRRSLELREVVEEELSFFEASSSEEEVDECPVDALVPFDEVEDQ